MPMFNGLEKRPFNSIQFDPYGLKSEDQKPISAYPFKVFRNYRAQIAPDDPKMTAPPLNLENEGQNCCK